MATKKYKPTTPGQRQRRVLDYRELTADSPEKSLLKIKSFKAGRNNKGRVTVRHRGGGVKRKYRDIDFKRDKEGVEGIVKSVEYDPYRSSFISLVDYLDGEKRYILTPSKLKVGSRIVSGKDAGIKVGNTLYLSDIPNGTVIHNVELSINKGAQLARSAGAFATIMGKNAGYVVLKLPSGEMRLVNKKCRATIGQVGNTEKRNTVLGKAGARRWVRRRPKVRGSVMNACDHPHGGGEGRAPVGQARPRTPWGVPTLGYKTRKKKKKSSSLIVKQRT